MKLHSRAMRLSPLACGRPHWASQCLALLVLAVLSACDGCSGDSRVPFKRPATVKEAADEPARAPRRDAGADQTVETPALLRFADAPSAVTLPAGPIDRGEGHIHAALLRERSEGNDALLLCSDDAGELSVERAILGAEGYGRLRAVIKLPHARGAACKTMAGSLEQPSSSHLLVQTTLTCERENPIADDRDSQFLGRGLYVLSDEEYPRLLERYLLRDIAVETDGDPTPLSLGARIAGVDVDQDGHADLRLQLTPQLGEQTLPTLAFDLIDRPSGLSLGGDEPEATLRLLADQALQSLGKNPSLALSRARRVRSLHGALCRGNSLTAIEMGGREGMPCERSVALARALAVAVVAHVKRGELLAALTAQDQMRDGLVKVLPADERRAQTALEQVKREPLYRFIEGPALSPSPAPPVHRPRVSFLESGHLLLRGTPPHDFTIDSGLRTPTSVATPGLTWLDPSGSYAATEFVRDCQGDQLLVYHAGQVVMGRGVGSPAHKLLLRPGSGGPCTAVSRARRIPADELSLLRWGREGLLLSQRGALWMLPLSADLAVQGAASPVAADEELPQRHEPDTLSISPVRFPRVTRLGVVLVSVADGKATLIDTRSVPGTIDEAALSPHADRIALVAGQRVFIGLPP